MKKCMKCGADMPDEAVFCTRCGTKLEGAGQQGADQQGADQQDASQSGAGQPDAGQSGAGQPGTSQPVTEQQYYNGGQENQGMYNGNNMNRGQAQYYAPPVDIYDHTAEFDRKDIAENKVIAMVAYLLGTMGVIIALLGAHTSRYAAFHVRQSLKFTVLEILIGIVSLLLFWTIIIPIAAGILYIILFVVRIICFFSICKGKAKEPPIIRSFGFLN